jgi:hypothetical protein
LNWLTGLFIGSSFLLSAAAVADEGQAEARPQHGGTVSSTKAHRFEVVFERGGLKVYPLTADGKPIETSGLSGTATFYHPNSPGPWFRRDLAIGTPSGGGRPTSLDLTMSLAPVPEAGAKVAFKISGFSDAEEPTAEFTTPVVFSAPPMLAFSVATHADQRAIAAQRVCKVSGKALGSMGVPIKVTRGTSSTFLCCRGCMTKVQADPDRYLGAKTESSREAAVERR